ncbi:hypothetical protein KC878_00005, partial [Candidatus Saccharibacteria bacterium]|nr:hypothetical protein [Candidatus Saccharibacteria bacterium]
TRAAEINDELKAEQAESQDVQEPCPLREVKVASEKLGLEELIENYVNQYRGTRLLYEDLVAAVEWLRKIDFSNGPVRGVKQHHYTIEIDGKMLPVYGLKPQDAVGVPTRSKTARHTRVTFTYTEQTITVVDIHYRGDMAQLERSLGLGAVRRG